MKYWFFVDQREMIALLGHVQNLLSMVIIFCCVVFPRSTYQLHDIYEESSFTMVAVLPVEAMQGLNGKGVWSKRMFSRIMEFKLD